MGSSSIGNVFWSLLEVWFHGERGLCVLSPAILPWKAAMPYMKTTLVRLTTSLWRCSCCMRLYSLVKLTSKKIQEQENHVTTAGEIPKNFKIFPAFVICGTSCRKALFDTSNFGRTDMPRSARDVCS
jgi:hypothetical protein